MPKWRHNGEAMLVDHKRHGLVKIRRVELVQRNKYAKPHAGQKQLARAAKRALRHPDYAVLREEIVAAYPETLAKLAE